MSVELCWSFRYSIYRNERKRGNLPRGRRVSIVEQREGSITGACHRYELQRAFLAPSLSLLALSLFFLVHDTHMRRILTFARTNLLFPHGRDYQRSCYAWLPGRFGVNMHKYIKLQGCILIRKREKIPVAKARPRFFSPFRFFFSSYTTCCDYICVRAIMLIEHHQFRVRPVIGAKCEKMVKLCPIY